MSSHARLSPSTRPYYALCPGRVRECAKYPEQPSSPAAIDGTHSHTLLEQSITQNKHPDSFIGAVLQDHEGEFDVGPHRAERVAVAYDYVQRRKAELGPGTVVKAEQRVDPKAAVGRDDMAGTADVLIGNLSLGVMEVIDLKDGMNPVDADSPQLRTYGVAALSELTADHFAQIKTLRLTVVQPKLALKGGDPIKFVDLSVDEFYLPEVFKMIEEAKATDDPNAPLVPGEVQCKYCAHKGACTALLASTMESSGIKFENLEVAQQAADKDPLTMTDQQIREIVESAPLIRQMLEGVEAEALRRMEAGKTIDGLKLVRGRGSRGWAFDDDQMADKLKRFGLPKDVLWETKLITPAKAEKIKWKKRDGTEKQLTERQLKTLKEEYIKVADGRLTVAPLSDSRPAVIMDTSTLFAPVETVPDWLK